MCNLTYEKDILLIFVTAILAPNVNSYDQAENLFLYGQKGSASTMRGKHAKQKVEGKKTESIRSYQKDNMLTINFLRYMGFNKKEIHLISGISLQTVYTYFESLIDNFPNRDTPYRTPLTEYMPSTTSEAFLDYIRETVSADEFILGNKDTDATILNRLESAIMKMAKENVNRDRIALILDEYLPQLFHAPEVTDYMRQHGVSELDIEFMPIESAGVSAYLLQEVFGPDHLAAA